MARRHDRHPISLDAIRRLDSGALRVPANLSRVGVQTYTQPDGTVRREYRPPEEVFRPETLDALRGAPLTLGHPARSVVRADSYSDLSVGHVADDVRADGVHTAATVQVSAQRGIDAVEGGVTELSLGYDTDLEMTPGVSPDGEAYDAIQRNIRPNHVALVPRGRGGASVALRLDAEDHQIVGGIVKIKIAGREYEAGSPEAIAAQADVERRLDAAEADTRRLRSLQSAQVRARAKSVGSTSRADADDQTVMLDAIAKIAPDVDMTHASPEFVAGAFAVAVAVALKALGAEAPEKPAAEPAAAEGASSVRADSVDRSRVRESGGETAEEVRQRIDTERRKALFSHLR